jgi:uncharacterized membrane protein
MTGPTPAPAAPTLPGVKQASFADIRAALGEGWADFRAATRFSAAIGLVFALGGLAVVYVLGWLDLPWLVYPIAMGFPLLGPFAAVGLYEISRVIERGGRPSWGMVIGTAFAQRGRELSWMAFVMLFVFWIWMYQVRLLMALFLGWSLDGSLGDFFTVLVTTPEGLWFLIVGHVVGAFLALVLFSITVVSIPLLLDRDVDVVTAIITSFRVVAASPVVMLGWGVVVTIAFMAGSLPAFLGLIVVIPVLGHTTWRLYRRVVMPA